MNIAVEFADTALQIQKDRKHDWLMPTKDVAAGYGVSEDTIRKHKERHADELLEGKHWVVTKSHTLGGKQEMVVWTKRGVIRLGFFIKSERAKLFRDWAEEFILSGGNQAKACRPIRLPLQGQIRELVKQFGKQAAMMTIAKSIDMDESQTEQVLLEVQKHESKMLTLQIDGIDERVEEFFEKRIIKKDGFVSVEKLYEEFETFCTESGCEAMSKINFGKEFKNVSGEQSIVIKVDGKATRGYGGMAIAPIVIDMSRGLFDEL